MTSRSADPRFLIILAGGMTLLAGSALAQAEGQALTRSLNTGPAQTTLTPRPDAGPALDDHAPRPSPRPQTRTLEDALADVDAEDTPEPTSAGVILAEGQTEPEPIPVTLGYYVRGDMDCDQAWPGEGNLAWMTPTAFVIDYGGCEPGQFLQTGPNSWREEQRCVTESGGDAGGYSVTYEVLGTDTVMRTARLALDNSVEEDLWRYCRTEDVSENARFMS